MPFHVETTKDGVTRPVKMVTAPSPTGGDPDRRVGFGFAPTSGEPAAGSRGSFALRLDAEGRLE